MVKNLPANARATGDESSTSGSGRSHGEGSGTHSSILAQRIPRTEELSRLQSTGPQRVRHDRATEHAEVHRKAERKTQRFPTDPLTHTCAASPVTSIPHQSGASVTTDEPTLAHYYHPKSIADIRGHSSYPLF